MRAFRAILEAVLDQSTESKTALIERERAALEQELVDANARPDASVYAAWTARHPKSTLGSRDQAYGLQLGYTLFDFGRTSAKEDLSANRLRISALNIDEVNAQLTWRVARAVVNGQGVVRLNKIAGQNLVISEGKLARVKDNYTRGLRPQNDLIAAQADQVNSKVAAQRAAAELQSAVARIQLLTNGKAEEIKKALETMAASEVSPESVENLLAKWAPGAVLQANSTTTAAIEGTLLEEDQVNASRRPLVKAQADAVRSGTWDKTDWNYSGQVQVTWDIPWKGTQRLEQEKIVQDRRLLEEQATAEQRGRQELGEVAQIRFQSSKALWDTVEEQIKLRAKHLELIKARYEAGKASSLEMSSAELELSAARQEQVRTVNALFIAAIDIAEARRWTDVESLF